MKKEYILLLIIPICFIFLTINLRSIEGPFYNGFADPSYVYLMNSLSLAQMNGSGIGHTDHPGTPLQVAGAVVIRIFYAFTHEKNDLVEDVFFRPEAYLTAINFMTIVLNAIGLYIMGLIIYNVKKNLFISLLFQTIPFVAINITEVFSLVKTESFVFFIAAIFISLMFKFVYDPPEKIKYFVIGTGILCGLILAVKIGFICLMLLPLVLFPGFRNKLIFILTAFLSFIAFIIPALSNTGYFVSWIMRLAFNSGRYGKGEATFINTGSFLNNLAKIFVNEKFFTVIYFLSLGILIFSFVLYRNSPKKNEKASPDVKFLLSLFLAMTLQIVLVAKHYSHRYMFIALILTIPALYAGLSILYKKYLTKININIAFGAVLIFILLFCAYNSRKLISRTRTKSNETAKLYDFIQGNYKNADIILTSGTSNEITGLALGYFYSAENVKPVYLNHLNELYPDKTWYDIFGDKIFSLKNQENVKNLLNRGRTVLLQTMDESYNDKFVQNLKTNYGFNNLRLSKVYSNQNGELLYELVE